MIRSLPMVLILTSLSCSGEEAEAVMEIEEYVAEVAAVEDKPIVDHAALVETQIRQFHEAMDLFKLNNYKYPDSLVSLTENDEITGQPILKAIPLDPWENSYVMELDSEGLSFIICFGADGKEGGDGLNQDISSKTLGL